MIQIFLSYARADGLDAATRLRNELTAMGFTVWRDLEEMRGGQAWKEQLRAALRTVDAVAVLLTPGAVASKTVEWEWENALTLNKRVVPLLIQPCAVPAELKRLHYHHLNTPDLYALGLARLVRDLLALVLPGEAPPAVPSTSGTTYRVGKATGSAIGRGATAINAPARISASAAKLAQAFAQRSASGPATPGDAGYDVETAADSAVGDNALVFNVQREQQAGATEILAQLQKLVQSQPVAPAHAAELQQTLQTIAGQLDGLDTRLASLEAKILARFAQSEQAILTTIVARLDEQDALMTEAVLEAVDIGLLTTDELKEKLVTIQETLSHLSQQPAVNPHQQQAVQQVLAAVEAPGLDVRHRLKVTIPLIPVLLSYEGEYEFNIRANLEAVWQGLSAWVRERGQ